MIDRSDGVIDLDLLITWPDDLRRLLDDNLDLLRAYELERARIDQLREDNFLVKYYRSQNDHAPGREAVVRQCDLILSDKGTSKNDAVGVKLEVSRGLPDRGQA